MNILYCVAGQNYIDYWTYTSIRSIVINNKNTNIDFHIITDNNYNFTKIEEYIKSTNNKLHIYKVDVNDFHNLKVSDAKYRWDYIYTTFYRLKVCDLIECSRCLYLDNDVICDGDLNEMYNTEIETVGVIKDLTANMYEGYFNAGVILMNLDNIKKKYPNFFELAINDSIKHTEDRFDDQDVLNRLFIDDKVFLEQKYNYFTRYGENVAVLYHFTGLPNRPWDNGFKQELNYRIYEKYSKEGISKINIVIATQEYRYEYLARRVIPTLLNCIDNTDLSDKIGYIYLVPNNFKNKNIDTYRETFKNCKRIKIIEGNEEYKSLNKFIPYYTQIGFDYPTIHMDDDLIVDYDFINSYIKTAEIYSDLVIGSGKCEYYQIHNSCNKIYKSQRLPPLVSDCITNMVWLNNNFIYFPKGLLKNSPFLDFELMKKDKYNKLYDESVLQLHLLLNNVYSYVINDTLNIGTDQLPYMNEYYSTVKTFETLTTDDDRNLDDLNCFTELANSKEYRNQILNNVKNGTFYAIVNNKNAMAVYLMKERLADIFRKDEIKLIVRPDEKLSPSWVDLIRNKWRVDR